MTPGNVADVSAKNLPFTYQVSTLPFPLQSCRSRMQKTIPLEKHVTHCIGSDSYGAGTRKSKYGSWAGTSALSPGVPRHSPTILRRRKSTYFNHFGLSFHCQGRQQLSDVRKISSKFDTKCKGRNNRRRRIFWIFDFSYLTQRIS